MKLNKRHFEALEAIHKMIGGFVTPVLCELKSSLLEQYGTITLIKMKEEYYFITANHVIEQLPGKDILVLGNTEILKMPKNIFENDYSKHAGEKYDICIANIPKSVVDKMSSRFNFWDMTYSEECKYDDPTARIVCFAGYPNSKNKLRPSSIIKQFSWGVMECAPTLDVSQQFLV